MENERLKQASTLAAAASEVLNTLLYFSGPFFGNPIKSLLQNQWCTTDYEMAYGHFRKDHTEPRNVWLHVCVLFLQVTTNFAFLHRLDELTGSPSWGLISTATAAGWLLLLLPQPAAPLAPRACVVVLIAFAYAVRRRVADRWEYWTWFGGVVEAAMMRFRPYGYLMSQAFLDTYLPLESRFVRLLCARWIVQALVMVSPLKGAMSKKGRKLAVALLSLIALLAMSYKPFEREGRAAVLLNILKYQHVGWLLSLITGERLFFLHSCAFGAANLQGLAHRVGREAATLPLLKNPHHEFAHVSYFPLLTLHRALEHLDDMAVAAAGAAAEAAAWEGVDA